MRPKKREEDENHPWSRDKKIVPAPEPNIKVRSYTLTFKDKPEIKHQITITKIDDWHTIRVIFSKPLLLPITNTMQHRDMISAKNLNELKQIIRNSLLNYGEYTIAPDEAEG